MNYELNKKNIKQSVKNLSLFLNQEGIFIERHKLLEGVSKLFFMKNWQTLEGVVTNPEQIKYIKNNKKYLIQIEIDCSKDKLMDLFKHAFKESKCQFNVVNYQNRNSIHLIELDLSNNNDNLITALFVFSNKIKETNYIVKKMEMARIFTEKEDLTELFN